MLPAVMEPPPRKQRVTNIAGTSKTAKADEPQLCPSCRELDKSTTDLKADIDKIIDKEAKFNFALSKKTEEYENKRQYLFSLIGPEYQKAVSALIEASGSGTVPTQAWLQLMECVLNNNAIRSPVNIMNVDDNRISHLTRRVVTNTFAPQPVVEANNEVSSLTNVLRSACLMNSSSSEEIEQELRDIVRNLNIPRQQQQVRPTVQALPNDISRNVNYILESLASRDAGVSFDRGGVVAPMRPPAPSIRYSTYQPTVPPPAPATYSPVTYSQTPNVVMQQPALAAPSLQVANKPDGSTAHGINHNNYNQYVNGRYNMVNYQSQMKKYP